VGLHAFAAFAARLGLLTRKKNFQTINHAEGVGYYSLWQRHRYQGKNITTLEAWVIMPYGSAIGKFELSNTQALALPKGSLEFGHILLEAFRQKTFLWRCHRAR
jgi:hypothetical protein